MGTKVSIALTTFTTVPAAPARNVEGETNMREINLDATDNPAVLPIHTFLGYGDTRAGKTTFFAGMPRPVVFADGTEKGWDSIANINDAFLFEPGVKPLVWAIDTQADIPLMIEKARPLIISGRICSILFDSITFYADLALASIIANQSKYDVRSAYGELGNNLRYIRTQVHKLGVSTAWTALCRHPDEDRPTGGPMIPGAQGDKFAAGVDFLAFFRKDAPANVIAAAKHGPKFEMHTKNYLGKYTTGTRLGTLAADFPNPFVGTYTDMLKAQGYDTDALRAGLKPLASIKPSAAPVVARPPITVSKPAAPAAAKPPAIIITRS